MFWVLFCLFQPRLASSDSTPLLLSSRGRHLHRGLAESSYVWGLLWVGKELSCACDRRLCVVRGPLCPDTTRPSSVESCLSGARRLHALAPLKSTQRLSLGGTHNPHSPLVISCPGPRISTPGQKLGHRCSIPLHPLFAPLPVTFQKWKGPTFPSCCSLTFTSFGIALVNLFPKPWRWVRSRERKIG